MRGSGRVRLVAYRDHRHEARFDSLSGLSYRGADRGRHLCSHGVVAHPRQVRPGLRSSVSSRGSARPRLLELVVEAAEDGVVTGRFAGIAREVERRLALRKGKRIPMNIDGATAVIYAELGFPPALARGLFCISRSVGILAHAWEQTQQGGRNKGPMPRRYLWRYDGPGRRSLDERKS